VGYEAEPRNQSDSRVSDYAKMFTAVGLEATFRNAPNSWEFGYAQLQSPLPLCHPSIADVKEPLMKAWPAACFENTS
jgi:hypothetical protein